MQGAVSPDQGDHTVPLLYLGMTMVSSFAKRRYSSSGGPTCDTFEPEGDLASVFNAAPADGEFGSKLDRLSREDFAGRLRPERVVFETSAETAWSDAVHVLDQFLGPLVVANERGCLCSTHRFRPDLLAGSRFALTVKPEEK
jgi:hypothetical protein